MSISTCEVIAFSHHADLDLLGAARCLMLKNPRAKLLHPVRLNQNAWEFARKQSWFKTIRFQDLDFKRIIKIHLIGISLPKHHPELIDQLTRHAPEVVLYSLRPAKVPFKNYQPPIDSLSITAHLLKQHLPTIDDLDKNDALLFAMAITEKTWAGLSSRTSRLDLDLLAQLRKRKISAAHIANNVVLGLREGQTGLYQHMLKSIEDIHPRNWPVSLICVNSTGQVQDLEPVVDAVWSDISPPIMVICISKGNFSRVWARSNIAQIDLAEIFKDFRPRISRNWVCFNSTNPQLNSQRIKDYLFQNLPPDQTADKIMSAAPQCIDWNATIQEALNLMLRFNIMSLIVTKDHNFAGLVTRRDLDRAVQMDLLDSPIGPYVPSDTPSVGPSTPVRVLKPIMVRYNLTRLPVIENGKVVGIITSRELLRALPDPMPLPPDFLPLAKQVSLPAPSTIEEAIKRVFSVKVFHILSRIGREAENTGLQAFAVGGFVRDLLLERCNLDIDIVVIGDALPFAKHLSEELACDFKVFDRFHTARIYYEDMKIDFSSARIEHYPDPGALPQIEFSGLSNDLFRRDFTINALALSLNPNSLFVVKDFFGGYSDLRQKRIRILHSFSFIEDPTRLFRALRFAHRFNFSLEKDTRRAFDLAIHRGCIERLSKKRISSEISRCLNEAKPHKIIADLFNAELMQGLSKELRDLSMIPGRFRLVPGLIKRFKVLEEEIDEEAVLWAGLLSAIDLEQATAILESTGTPHSRQTIICNILHSLERIPEALGIIDQSDHVALYKLLNGCSIEALIALMAYSLEKVNSRKVLHFMGNLRQIKPELCGDDLIAVGIPPGPHMRRIFKKILEIKLGGQCLNREKELEIALQEYKNI